jgi:hypothetical protein
MYFEGGGRLVMDASSVILSEASPRLAQRSLRMTEEEASPKSRARLAQKIHKLSG